MPDPKSPWECIGSGDQLSYQDSVEHWIRTEALTPLREELTKFLNQELKLTLWEKDGYGLLLTGYVVSRFAGSWYRIFEENLREENPNDSQVKKLLEAFGGGTEPKALRTLLMPAQEQYQSKPRKESFLVHPDLKQCLWIWLEADLKWDDKAKAKEQPYTKGHPLIRPRIWKVEGARGVDASENWRKAVAQLFVPSSIAESSVKLAEIEQALEQSFFLTRLVSPRHNRSVFILPYRAPVPYYETEALGRNDIWLTIGGLLVTPSDQEITGDDIFRILVKVYRKVKELGRQIWEEELTQSRPSVLSSVARESLIRDACRVEKNILKKLDRNKDFVRNNVKDVDNDDKLNEWKDPEKSGFLWASPAFHQLLDDLKRTVDPGEGEKLESRTVFIYGRPGTGKENIARLLHLLSGRASRDDKWKSTYEDAVKAVKDADQNKGLFSPFYKKWLRWPSEWKGAANSSYPSKDNYFGAAATAEGSFSERFLRGERREKNRKRYWPGYFRLAHATAGTLFLDEFNTLRDPAEADKLLRVLDKPYQLHFADDSTISDLNILLVVASNLDRDQLLEKNFNEAVIGRITAKSFRIPSLVERPEDVALFVLKHLIKFKEDVKIENVEFSAMRLLCELDWPNNYRDLASVLSSITDDRKNKGVIKPTLTFDEVLTAVNRLQILRKGS